MLWLRKRNSAVYVSLLGSLVYLLYTLVFVPASSDHGQTRNRGTLSSSLTFKQDYGPGGKSRMQWDEQVPRTRVVQGEYLHCGHAGEC